MDNAPIELSILMPCLNEALTLPHCIEKAQYFIERNGLCAEIVVADNGSTDGSQDLARALGARVVDVPEKGYGNALRGGIEAAQGAYVIMADADDSYSFAELDPFLEKLRLGFDLVMGCRLPRGGGTISPGAMPWKNHWLGNPGLSFLGRLFFKTRVTDFHCGMRGFRKDAYERMRLQSTGMEFASEMVIKAHLVGLRVTEAPITLYKDGRNRKPHLRSFRDGWRHLRLMLLFCPKWLFLIPGLLLFLIGVIGGGALVCGAVSLGSVSYDINSLSLASLAVLVGFQLIVFSVFVKVFAMTSGFMPQDSKLMPLFKYFKLETGLVCGITLVLVGAFLLVLALGPWGIRGFGELSPLISARIVVPSVTLQLLGVQTVFSSFFLSILSLASGSSGGTPRA